MNRNPMDYNTNRRNSVFSFLKSASLLITIAIILFILPEVPRYQWAENTKEKYKNLFSKDRFLLFNQLNNVIDIDSPLTWFIQPIHTLKYIDTDTVMSFPKTWNYDCKIGLKCPAWTHARIFTLTRNNRGQTLLSESFEVFDCSSKEWGFYDAEKQHFRFSTTDKKIKDYAINIPQKEFDFLCKLPGNKYLMDTSITKIEQHLRKSKVKLTDRILPVK